MSCNKSEKLFFDINKLIKKYNFVFLSQKNVNYFSLWYNKLVILIDLGGV